MMTLLLVSNGDSPDTLRSWNATTDEPMLYSKLQIIQIYSRESLRTLKNGSAKKVKSPLTKLIEKKVRNKI